MIPQYSSIHARVVGAIAVSPVPQKGVVESVDGAAAVIRIAAGTVTVHLAEGTLAQGDTVALARQGDRVLIQKLPLPAAQVPPALEAYALNLKTEYTPQDIETILKEILARLRTVIQTRNPAYFTGMPLENNPLQPSVPLPLFQPADQQLVTLPSGEMAVAGDAGSIMHRIEQLLHRVRAVGDETVSSIRPLLTQLARQAAELPLSFTAAETGSQEPMRRLADTLTQLQNMLETSARPSSPLLSRPPAAVLAGTVQPGLYYFPSLHDALEWIGRQNPTVMYTPQGLLLCAEAQPIDIAQAQQRLAPVFGEGAVVLRAAGLAEENAVQATIVQPAEALVEIEHILKSDMHSALMRRIEPRMLLETLEMARQVPLKQLRLMDTLLASFEAVNADAPQISTRALEISWPQWVLVALKAADALPPEYARSLTAEGALVPEAIQRLGHHLGDVAAAAVQRLGIMQSALQEPASMHTLIPELLQSLGYTLEHDLAGARLLPSGRLSGDVSLKVLLLLLLHEIDRAHAQATGDETRGERGTTERADTRLAPLARLLAERIAVEQDGREHAASLEALRQQVQTALERLESMQMMARPVQTAEGQQQVVVLPMMIDGEWVEARFRFVKKKGGGGKKRPPRFAVTMNVNPTFLGEITVHIEYMKGRAMAVGMEFEKSGARTWFERRRSDIARSLEARAGAGVHVDFHDAGRGQNDVWGESRQQADSGRFERWG